MLRTKSCLMFLSGLVGLLAVAWTAGNLLIDVGLDGREVRDESLISEVRTGELHEAFRGLPAAGIAESGLELLDDNAAAWSARWRLLADARESLEISYFILDADIFGFSFLGHLLKKAEEGVRVRILLDAIGTALSREIEGNDYLDALANERMVTVKVYRPYLLRFRDTFLELNLLAMLPSDHDKILVADGRHALIGGRNIAREYLADPLDYDRAFHDADALLHGGRIGSAIRAVFEKGFESAKAQGVRREALDLKDSAADLKLAYEAMNAWLRGKPVAQKVSRQIRERGLPWLEELRKLPRLKGALQNRPAERTSAEVRLLDSRPRLLRSDDAVSKSLARLAGAAREEIFIQVPYVILSDYSVSVLEKAAARGVGITIFTNSPVSTDNPLSQAFFLEQWPELLARLPTLRLFVAGDKHNIHAKLGAIDGKLALIGTYNLDPLSMSLNGELVAAVWSRAFAEELVAKPKQLIAGGAAAVYEYRIERDSSGRPKRDPDGAVMIAFGPEDHSSPEQWKTVQWYRRLLRLAAYLPGTSRILWQADTKKAAEAEIQSEEGR